MRKVTVALALIVAAGCGSGDDGREVDVGRPIPTPDCAAAPEASPSADAGPVGMPAPEGFEVIGEEAQSLPPGATGTFEVEFEGASEAAIWVLPGGGGISASMDGAEFVEDELLGAPVTGATLSAPADGQVLVHNGTGEAADVGVIVFVQTGRRLTVEASPHETAPTQPVAVTVRLGEATATESPCVGIARDGVAVATLPLEADGLGTWRATFRPDSVGHYAFQAWVGGDRARRSLLAYVTVG